MEKNQYNLCLEVLERFERAGVLKDIILIGSWCVLFYKDYFSGTKYSTAIKTRDIDFLVPTPSKIKIRADIPNLLKDLGFVLGFKGPEGYIQLEHADLIVEFMVPERGRGLDKPLQLPQFGLNATTLRFLNFLSSKTIKVKIKDFYLTLPHPINFALHKLIVARRRLDEDKAIKDRKTSIETLKALIVKGEKNIIQNVFRSIPKKWQSKIKKSLKDSEEKEILDMLTKK